MAIIIENFVPYQGEHCETTAMGNLLQFAGVRLSEPMLFGLGQGLGFIYWDSKQMDFPFIGGRVKPDVLTANLIGRLGLTVSVQETSSVDKAWRNVRSCIEQGVPVGLKLDSYYLDYFTSKVHFAAHYAVLYGMDDEFAYMADTRQQGGRVKTAFDQLGRGQKRQGPHEFPESFLYARANRRPAAARSRDARGLDQECARLFEPAHSQYRV